MASDARFTPRIKSRISIQQAEDSFNQQTGLKVNEETAKMLHLEHSYMVLKIGHFGK
jgi:hypothetical protein